MSKEKLTPAEYFESVKDKKSKNTNESLDKFYDAALVLLDKYKKLGQKKMIEKLMFIIECIPKERQLIEKGIDTFIYKDDIEEFINEIENKTVKIIELKDYPREVPEEFIEVVEGTKEIFDKFYVLFTDYTGKEERRVAKERREKDPILFGAFVENRIMNDRFYYLGDWEDEFCDLTLEKIIELRGNDIVKTITTPINKEELMQECARLVESKTIVNGSATTNGSGANWIITNFNSTNNSNFNSSIQSETPKKIKLFDKVKSIFKK